MAAAAVAAALLIAASYASAQNPSADQYTPVTPSGGGPMPAVSGGIDKGASGDTAAPGGTSGQPSTSTEGVTGAAAPADSTRQRGGESGPPARNRDQLALDGIVTAARQQFASNNQVVAARLLRNTGGDAGMGGLFWALLGAALIWATLIGIRRRRGGDVSPARYDDRNPP